MTRQKIEFITYIYIYVFSQVSIFSFHITWLTVLNVIAIRVQRHTNVENKMTLAYLNGTCGCDLNGFVYESMSDISNVKVHLKTSSGNVNI